MYWRAVRGISETGMGDTIRSIFKADKHCAGNLAAVWGNWVSGLLRIWTESAMVDTEGKGDGSVKITVHTDAEEKEINIHVTCPGMTPEIERILSMLHMLNKQLVGHKEGEMHLIEAADVLYIDTADKRTFLYTKNEIYETELKLYELEEQLKDADFFRANKSCIINFRHIASLKSELNRRLLVTMTNGEKLIVSRQYAEYVKEKLEVR